jgi:transposase
MRKTFKFDSSHTEAISQRLSSIRDAIVFRRVQVIYFLSLGLDPEEIHVLTGFCTKTIQNFGLEFHEKGLETFGLDGRMGGNNRHLTDAEARKFLEEFEGKANAGHVLTVSEM